MILEIILILVVVTVVIGDFVFFATDFLRENFPERYLLAQRHKYRKLLLEEKEKEKPNNKKIAKYVRQLDDIEDELNLYYGR